MSLSLSQKYMLAGKARTKLTKETTPITQKDISLRKIVLNATFLDCVIEDIQNETRNIRRLSYDEIDTSSDESDDDYEEGFVEEYDYELTHVEQEEVKITPISSVQNAIIVHELDSSDDEDDYDSIRCVPGLVCDDGSEVDDESLYELHQTTKRYNYYSESFKNVPLVGSLINTFARM